MPYLYIDGDGIGHKIESCFLQNDEYNLAKLSEEVSNVVGIITQYLESKNQRIILSAADGIVCNGPAIDLQSLMEYIRGNSRVLTFSVGQGHLLSHAYLGLRYAKANGKDTICISDGLTYKMFDYK